MEEEKQEEIKVTDRRQFHADGTPRWEATEGATGASPPSSSADQPQPAFGAEASVQSETSEASPSGVDASPQPEGPPAPTFSGFLMGLIIGAQGHLGLLPHPESGESVVDLPLAKQMIDILAMLQEKTKGNLTPEEEQSLQHSLTELRWTYVQVASKQ